MNVYTLKLYSLLRSSLGDSEQSLRIIESIVEPQEKEFLNHWWENQQIATKIAASSDRTAFSQQTKYILQSNDEQSPIEIRHLVSGQNQEIPPFSGDLQNLQESLKLPDNIKSDPKQVFWWMWRFYPEIFRKIDSDSLLLPANLALPDCSIHSYSSTVSALTGAMYPQDEQANSEHPYLILFTFSPVQEFIKASRKFLDFWAGSYLLHYLSVKVCWYIAEQYGPDAVITPSLWGQEIIDALTLQKYPHFEESFKDYTESDPVSRFKNRTSVSLSTAGFPNVVTAVVPGLKNAKELGEKLSEKLKEDWKEIGFKVRETIKEKVMDFASNTERKRRFWEKNSKEFIDLELYQKQLDKWQHGGNWEWNKLWEAQLDYTWETYWTVVPLGDPDKSLESLSEEWFEAQNKLSQARVEIPTSAERQFYSEQNSSFNIGTWWGSLQQRLGQSIQAVKNTRTWQIPVAPGERSTLSGQFSAVHPNLLYKNGFREGAGISAGSMRLFWRVMAEVFPGLFNGSEKLNALELTKRMAWVYGGVAESLGVGVKDNSKAEEDEQINYLDYENFIRFPNLSSIAAARFAHEHPKRVKEYWECLNEKIQKSNFLSEQKKTFYTKTHRPFQIKKTDKKLKDNDKDYNGVMFSSKWLAEDMGLEKDQISELRNMVDQAHKKCGFGDSSPSDWWVIVLGDGDNMGKYVSGRRLKPYNDYLNKNVIEEEQGQQIEREFLETRKRMGPATHVGLNRALLDFSNRLVPYLTEERCCGRVVYSGGDDVLPVLPVEDLPEYLCSLQAAWQGGKDPEFESKGGYWFRKDETVKGFSLDKRRYFTMGKGATMSMGVVIAHKSVPLPTVLENLWEAEKDRAKKIPGKDGLCFRVIYSSGNTLEALMKGSLLQKWNELVQAEKSNESFSPLLYRLAEELPKRCQVTEDLYLFKEAAQVIINRREDSKQLKESSQALLFKWLDKWEKWAFEASQYDKLALGTQPEDLGRLLKFTGYWIDRMCERSKWAKEGSHK